MSFFRSLVKFKIRMHMEIEHLLVPFTTLCHKWVKQFSHLDLKNHPLLSRLVLMSLQRFLLIKMGIRFLWGPLAYDARTIRVMRQAPMEMYLHKTVTSLILHIAVILNI